MGRFVSDVFLAGFLLKEYFFEVKIFYESNMPAKDSMLDNTAA